MLSLLGVHGLEGKHGRAFHGAECISGLVRGRWGMLSKAKTGSYTSDDGGKSAMRLMVECDAQWTPWQNKCMADGETDGDCSVKAAAPAQSAIKLAGK